MAVLETIRNKFGILITVLIAIALLSFIIDPSSLLSSMNAQKMNNEDVTVAEINGHKVSYLDFENLRHSNTSTNLHPNIDSKIYRNYVHNYVMMNFINNYLYAGNAKNAGFKVSDKEMALLLSGNIPSSAVSPDMTVQMLEDMEARAAQDPEYNAQFNQYVKDVENNRYKYKYDEYLMRSSFENPLIAENQFNISNNKYNVRFIQIPFSAADPSIEVSEDEIAEYYNSHMNHYRINDTRGIDYVIVELDDENYDAISEKADSVFADVKGIEEFRKAAEDNGYSLLATDMTMISNTLESVKNTANVTKWAFGKNVGNVSDPFTVVDDDEKSYLVVACVTKANDTGYAPMEEVAEEIKGYIAAEKAGDKLLAEVTEKVKGLNDLESMEEVLGVASIEKEMRFAVNDLDKRFAGAVSTAEKGIVNAPFKGSNSIYIYELIDSSVDSFYTDENVADDIMMVDVAYMNKYNYYLGVNQEFMITWNQYINNALSEQPVEVPDNVMTYLATYFPYDFILNPDLVKDYTSLHTSDI